MAVVLTATWTAATARADGDPASDVLASQSLFVPQDAGIPATQQQRLAELLRSASGAGFPVRVALIAGPTDLGSITALWRRPQSHASFLGQELGLVYRGPLLVVMPNGYGTYQAGAASGFVRGLPVPGSGAALATAALTAIQRLAAAAGHDLPPPSATGASTSGSGSADIAAWLAFAAGVLVILVAWGASLRARPLRAGHGTDPAST